MDHDYIIHTTPTKEELDIVNQWLYQEYVSNNKLYGFYCNWNLIEEGVNEQRVIVCSFKNKPIGIVLWSEYEGCAKIDIFVIQQSKRAQGFGAVFVTMLSDYFQKINAFVIKLFCEPEKSISFWRDKLNFIQYPKRGYSESSLTLYKPLVLITPCTNVLDAPCRLELWNVEPYESKKIPPRWVWEIDSDLINRPILQPCNSDWNLRFIKNNVVVKEDKVKYFGSKAHSCERGDFLYINNIEID